MQRSWNHEHLGGRIKCFAAGLQTHVGDKSENLSLACEYVADLGESLRAGSWRFRNWPVKVRVLYKREDGRCAVRNSLKLGKYTWISLTEETSIEAAQSEKWASGCGAMCLETVLLLRGFDHLSPFPPLTIKLSGRRTKYLNFILRDGQKDTYRCVTDRFIGKWGHHATGLEIKKIKFWKAEHKENIRQGLKDGMGRKSVLGIKTWT